jgi:anti-sigma regulatory factor (Ser/Thr protein kinase)
MTITTQEEAPAPKVMRWSWRRHPRCVYLARRQLERYLRYWEADELLDTGRLLLSELLTNAIHHAHVSPGREVETVFEINEQRLRVEVSDASNEIPIVRHPGNEDEEGRGLHLVAQMASRWGVDARKVNEAYAIGKTVWFELDRPGGL